MRIVVTGLRGFPNIQGGVETHCEELYPRLVQRGCSVTLLRRRPFVKETPPLTSFKGVAFKDLPAPRKSGWEAAVHTLRGVWYARCTRADLVHIHSIGPSIAVPLARILGLKTVVTHHGPDYDRKKWGRLARCVLKAGEYCAARWANELIVISTVIRDLVREKYHRNRRVHLIPNGVNAAVRVEATGYVRSLGLAPGKYILAVGRLVEEKNFDKLIAAYAQLSRGATADYKLVIAGDADHATAYSDALKKLASDHHVILTGMVKGQSLQELYTHAGLFVLPSSHEGLPITLLEAMSYGIDVLVSDIPANCAVGLPADCYFHCGEDCSSALFRALEVRIQNLPNRHPAYDLTPYEWDTIADKTIEVYRGLLR